MTPAKKSAPEKKNVTTIRGDVVDSVIVTGDNNQTIIQKFFNIFKSDSETLEQRNRRILLGHVENAWIKGVLDASLHGAALLDLGIKQDPEAVTKYPWAIKKESTDETLPAGTSMLEIFDSIGMGRSLLILGAPGSGKTTMLLELARGLIARAREDVTQPIPMVFNLASWREKLSLADWLAQELNNLYSVPRKTTPDWVRGNKLLLLLDGLDEVRQESRAKCVEAINAFRKEHGLTSLAVCSRSQDYADLNAKLSFEGAIEVQPLTQGQIAEFFNRFGDEMAGIKQVLKKDSGLREMAETPLFLSIMLMAYRSKQEVDILSSQGEKAQRKHLFDTYIERMFERPRLRKMGFKKQNVLQWLLWLAQKMIEHSQYPYLVENTHPRWLSKNKQGLYTIISVLIIGLIGGLLSGLIVGINFGYIFGLIFGLVGWLSYVVNVTLKWDYRQFRVWLILGLIISLIGSLIGGLVGGLFIEPILFWLIGIVNFSLKWNFKGFQAGLILGFLPGLMSVLIFEGFAFLQHYTLRFILARNNLLPWRLVPFLDHCVDLIFLRRVGSGYIFVHRLLMEHFAEMYVETPTSKGN
jgi:hypothetical protein